MSEMEEISKRVKNIIGERYGSLTVLEFSGTSPGKAKAALWKCKCDCGVEKVFYSNALKSGGTTSCGCEKSRKISKFRTSHGMTYSRTYYSWMCMRNRCYYENDISYSRYGGRGIKVCNRWKNSFKNFLADMGERPKGMTLDRIDNDKDYSPDNCKWSTSKEQARNRRDNRVIKWKGEDMTVAEFAERIGIKSNVARHMIVEKGVDPEEIAKIVSLATITVINEDGVSRVEDDGR